MKLSFPTGKLRSLRAPRAWAGVFFSRAGLELATARGQTGSVSDASELRDRLDPRLHRIATAVACEHVLCETVKLPTAEPGELKQMLDLQIDRLTPLPLEEVVYGFQPLSVADGQTEMLVAIARKEVVNERVGALEAVGLPAEVVSLDVLAVFRDLVARGALPQDDNLNALVFVSDPAMNVIIHSRGRPVAVRSILCVAEAAREELQRTLLAAQAEQTRGALGEVAFMPWGVDRGAACEQLARVWGATGRRLPEIPGLSPASSLCAESAAAAEQTRLNLLPDEWRQRRRAARLRRQLTRAAMIAGSVYVAGLLVFLALLFVRQSRLSHLRAQANALRPQYAEARRMHSELVAMQKQLDTTYSSLEVLREVTTLMPGNLKLNSFQFKKDQSVTLRGQSQAAAAAIDFQSRLEKCRLFSSVSAGRMASEAGGLTRFEIVCSLKSATEVPAAHGAK